MVAYWRVAVMSERKGTSLRMVAAGVLDFHVLDVLERERVAVVHGGNELAVGLLMAS